MDDEKIHFGSITKRRMTEKLLTLNFRIVKSPSDSFIYVDTKGIGNAVIFSKPQRLNMLSCVLKKKDGRSPLYTVLQVGKALGSDELKKNCSTQMDTFTMIIVMNY